MPRIRTIKPEFQNSQSMGRVSRDARLLFIELWPQCDDAGRIRANSRMLASILFPYDLDAQGLIDGWLQELENEQCIVRYRVGADEYLQVSHWEHQKIDHPQPSKLPPPPAKNTKKTKLSVREQPAKPREQVENVRAVSSTVPERIKDQDLDQGTARSADADVRSAFDAFNVIAEEFGWPKAQMLTDKRKRALKLRMSEAGGLRGWLAAMDKAKASPFLRGDSGRDNAHAGWAPDLDFFLQQSSFTKLMEGKYDQRGRVQSTGFDALREGASRAAGVDRERGQRVEDAPDPLLRLAVSGSA